MKILSKYYGVFLYILVLLSFLLILDTKPIFYNNDDFFLKQIASGELTGTPQSHLLHIGYLTGLLLSMLYSLFPSVNWYGIMLFSYGFLGVSVPFYLLSKRISKKWIKIFFLIFTTVLSVSFLWIHILQVQYTTITAIISGVSLLTFYLSEETTNIKDFLKQNTCSLITFFLALELRSKACIMFLPSFFLIAFVKYIKNKSLFKPLISFIGTILFIMCFFYSTEKLAYSNEAWETFRNYNTSRENIVDYAGYPEYIQNQEMYKSLGITQESFVAASTRYQLLLDENIDSHFMEEVEKHTPPKKINLIELITNFWDRHFVSPDDRPLNLIVFIFYLFTVLLIILSSKWNASLDVFAIWGGRMTIWLYLLYVGRIVTRVTQGIYIVEFFLLLGVIIKHHLYVPDNLKKRNLQKICLTVFILCILATAYKKGLPNTKRIMQLNQLHLYHSMTYKDISDYFYNHAENLYLLDTMSFSYFTETVFQSTPPSKNNFAIMGSWLANSPWIDSIAEQYQITSYEQAAVEQDNVFFVFMNSPDTTYNYLETYFTSRYPAVSLEVYDIVPTSTGIEFYILQVTDSKN